MPSRTSAASSRSAWWKLRPGRSRAAGPVRVAPAVMATLSLFPVALAAAADGAARISFVESSHSDAAGPAVTAIGLRSTGEAAADAMPPTEVVILVDTSASQTGEHRQRSLEALAGVLEGARDADRFLAECRDVYGLEISGLMCIPPVEEDPKPHFDLLAAIARRNGLSGLSMGMSGDYVQAVASGATHVRVGSAIFGTRG